MKVLLLGSTGLVGGHCLRLLQADPRVSQIFLPVRKIPMDANTSKALYVAVDFSRLADHASLFAVDAVICCLGTTLRKAGSRPAFEQTDVGIPLAAAALAHKAKVPSFGLVSAQGAHPRSFFFYNRCKGLLEQGLRLLEFPSLTVVRPSLLLGERKEHRPLESFLQKVVHPALPLIPSFWRPVGADQVARALVNSTLAATPGVHILYNRTLTDS